MSYPENEDEHSITALKLHELLHIFSYLGHDDLLQCRLVCPYWYQLIKDDSRLIDRFRFKLNLNSETLLVVHEPPFSVIQKSKIKVKSITINDDFLDSGNSIAIVETNQSKMSALATILTDLMAEETVTEMIVHARDNESRTNSLLFEMIMKMKNIKVLRFTLPAFVHSLETMCTLVQCKSLEYIQILHTDFKRLIFDDFERMLRVFPNIKCIDVKPSEAMLLDENILQQCAPLIKSIEKLESYTLVELFDIHGMSLNHISYECCGDEAEDVRFLNAFFAVHNEIDTMCLQLLNGSSKIIDKQVAAKIIELDLKIKQFQHTTIQSVYELQLCNILKWMSNLRRLNVKLNRDMAHNFGHKTVEMTNLTHVTMTKFKFNCVVCCVTMLKSMVHVKSLKLMPNNSQLSLEQVAVIARNLEQLECLELIYDDNTDLQNHFHNWPRMPNLIQLIVNRVGYLTEEGIKNLRTNCSMLKVIKLYSLRGTRIYRLLKLTIESFPNIEAITFRGGRAFAEIPDLKYINGKVGWRLKELDISGSIKETAILELFQNNELLELVRCKYGAITVTRRTYYEITILKAYNLKSVEQPLKNRKRLHLEKDSSSDSETTNSEESSSESSNSDEDESDED